MKNDSHFDHKTCIGGLLLNAILIRNHYFNYCLHLTFKKSLKHYGYELAEVQENHLVDHPDFFKTVDDPFVQLGWQSVDLAMGLENDIALRHALLAEEVHEIEDCRMVVARYQPYYPPYLLNRSYARVLFHLISAYDCVLLSLYYFACALTVQDYKIPLVMRTRIDYSFTGSYRHLDTGHPDVKLLLEVMEEFKEKQNDMNALVGRLKPYISCPTV